jgi:prepilin-type N-terminal cleavage/methylation domain-containing protein
MKKPQTIYNKGFTLIELMVVIGIISLLSAVVLGSLTTAKAKAENTKQIADYRVVLNALLQFKQDNGYYPSDNGQANTFTCIGEYTESGGCKMNNSIKANSAIMKSSLQKYLSSYTFVDKPVTIAVSAPIAMSSDYKGFILSCTTSEDSRCKTATLLFPALKNNNSCPRIMSDISASESLNNVISTYTWCRADLN